MMTIRLLQKKRKDFHSFFSCFDELRERWVFVLYKTEGKRKTIVCSGFQQIPFSSQLHSFRSGTTNSKLVLTFIKFSTLSITLLIPRVILLISKEAIFHLVLLKIPPKQTIESNKFLLRTPNPFVINLYRSLIVLLWWLETIDTRQGFILVSTEGWLLSFERLCDKWFNFFAWFHFYQTWPQIFVV